MDFRHLGCGDQSDFDRLVDVRQLIYGDQNDFNRLMQYRETLPLSDRQLNYLQTVSDHLQDVQVNDQFQHMGITGESNFSQINETNDLQQLRKLQENSPPFEELEQILCKVNAFYLPHFREGRFPTVARQLGNIAIPIVRNLLKQAVPRWDEYSEISRFDYETMTIVPVKAAFREQFSLEDEFLLAEVIKKLAEKQFPCHGVGTLLMDRHVFRFEDFEKVPKEKMPVYEALCYVDPMSPLGPLGLAISQITLVNEPGVYSKITALLEKVIENGSFDFKDIACKSLSELLQKGALGFPPNTLKAKQVLQRLVDSSQALIFPRSTKALIELLKEENSPESCGAAFELNRQLSADSENNLRSLYTREIHSGFGGKGCKITRLPASVFG